MHGMFYKRSDDDNPGLCAYGLQTDSRETSDSCAALQFPVS